MNRVIVLAMHGAPPRDFPRQEAGEFFGLSSRLRQPGGGPERAVMEQRRAELEAKMRAWPRTPQNDPFHAASLEMAASLQAAAGCRVLLAFGEFCAPSIEEALDEAGAAGGDVVVITPMMTRGGDHSEVEIPAAIRAAQQKHPGTRYVYAWPYDTADVVRFLTMQIDKFSGR